MSEGKKIGTIEDALAHSSRQDIRALCQLSNMELLDAMDAVVDSDGPFDEELFIAAQDLLAERTPSDKLEDEEVDLSLETFRKTYADELKKEPERHNIEKKPVKRMKWGGLLAAAVLICATVVGAAFARGDITSLLDFGDVVVRTVLHGPSGQLERQDHLADGYVSLKDAFEQTGVTNVKTYTWLPSDLSLTVATVSPDTKGLNTYYALYEAEKRSLVVSVRQGYGSLSYYAESNDLGDAETVEIDGVKYDIVENNGFVTVSWKDGIYSFSMSGGISRAEAKEIIKSLK